jgi:uncharacterized protein YecA (UPF0149 family)
MLTLTFGSQALSLAFSQQWSIDSIQQAFVESKARLLTMVKVESSLVALFQVGADMFKLTSCAEIQKSAIDGPERASLQKVRREQEKRDFAGISRKVGRNETCPCGSGLKYKRCCHGS